MEITSIETPRPAMSPVGEGKKGGKREREEEGREETKERKRKKG